LVFVLAALGAVGVCAIFVAAVAPALLGLDAWPVLIAGAVTLTGAVTALWRAQHRRDRSLW